MHPLVSQQLAEARLSDRYREAESRRLAGAGMSASSWRASLGEWLVEAGLRLLGPADRSAAILIASRAGSRALARSQR